MGECPANGLGELVWPRVNFRARLRLFFVLLVIVPMIALAVVLFTLTARSETGKADAGIAAPERTAARASRTGIRLRLEQLDGGRSDIVAIELRSSQQGRLIARAGSPTGMAYKAAPLVTGAKKRGTLFVSLTDAPDFAARVRRLTA